MLSGLLGEYMSSFCVVDLNLAACGDRKSLSGSSVSLKFRHRYFSFYILAAFLFSSGFGFDHHNKTSALDLGRLRNNAYLRASFGKT